jgi:LPS-assembly lipoprotein
MRISRLLPIMTILAVAPLLGGCFQPLYGERTVEGGAGSIAQVMRHVDVAELKTARGTRIDRVGFEIRNKLIYGLTGGGGAAAPAYRLDIKLTANQQQIVVDASSGRADVQNYGIDADYTMTDLATGKVVVRSLTSARVSFNIPGQQQRFAGERGLRDAENRAAGVIAEGIRNRLASYFTAGT